MLKTLSSGFGYLAFAGLAEPAPPRRKPESPLAPKAPHFPARAKRVIFLCMRGGPSHVDTFDYKPKLTADTGKPGQRPGTKLLGSKWNFSQRGKSGLWISELFPNVAQARRRAVPPAQHADRCAGASAGLHEAAHRQLPVRAAVARRVVALRARHGEREPAGLRHAHAAERFWRRAKLRQLVSAGDLPGHAHRQRQSADRRRHDPQSRVAAPAGGAARGARSRAVAQSRRAAARRVQSRRSKASSKATSSPSACRARCRR